MREDFIYTRDLDILVGKWKWWRTLMNALIKCLDDYADERNDYAGNLRITYVKDKYWRLRCEYGWWDDYATNLIENTEDLSEYIDYE